MENFWTGVAIGMLALVLLLVCVAKIVENVSKRTIINLCECGEYDFCKMPTEEAYRNFVVLRADAAKYSKGKAIKEKKE